MGALIESPANASVYTRCPIRICRTTWVDCCPMRFNTGVTRTTTLLELDMRRAHVFSQTTPDLCEYTLNAPARCCYTEQVMARSFSGDYWLAVPRLSTSKSDPQRVPSHYRAHC